MPLFATPFAQLDLVRQPEQDGEGAEGVVEDQHPALRRHAPFVQLVE
ncbi:hypothetical protein, partial [Pseudomonas aeruginosa]